MAEAAGTRHRVIDSEPTGVVTDEQDPHNVVQNADQADDGGGDEPIEVKDLP